MAIGFPTPNGYKDIFLQLTCLRAPQHANSILVIYPNSIWLQDRGAYFSYFTKGSYSLKNLPVLVDHSIIDLKASTDPLITKIELIRSAHLGLNYVRQHYQKPELQFIQQAQESIARAIQEMTGALAQETLDENARLKQQVTELRSKNTTLSREVSSSRTIVFSSTHAAQLT